MSYVKEVARKAIASTYGDLSDEVVAQTKTLILDSVGCIYGGLSNPGVEALTKALPNLWGRPAVDGATIVAGDTGSVLDAVLLNGAALRYLDFNDVQDSHISQGPRHGHNSEILPAVLAIAESRKLSGKDVITALSLGYDVATAFTDAVLGKSLEQRGWNMDLRAHVVMPIVAGYLMELDEDQIHNAVGIALSRGVLLNVLDSAKEPNTMAKNLRFPLSAQLSVVAATLAAAGMTGPKALEGDSGFVSSALDGDFDAERFTSLPRGRVLEAALKKFAACYSTHGHLTATMQVVLENDVQFDDVDSVAITATTRGAGHTGNENRRYPDDKETADHSSFYLTAIAIKERNISPAQYSPAKYSDPAVRQLVDRITVTPDASLDPFYPAARVAVKLKDGTVLEREVRHPSGHPQNKMTDDEVADKFRSMAGDYATESRQQEIIAGIGSLEQVDDIRDLMKLMRR